MKTLSARYTEARLQIFQERMCDACMTLTVAPFRKYGNAPNLNTSTVANRDGKSESEEGSLIVSRVTKNRRPFLRTLAGLPKLLTAPRA